MTIQFLDVFIDQNLSLVEDQFSDDVKLVQIADEEVASYREIVFRQVTKLNIYCICSWASCSLIGNSKIKLLIFEIIKRTLEKENKS